MAGINRKHDDKLVFETSEDVKGTFTHFFSSIPSPPSKSSTSAARGMPIYSPKQQANLPVYYFIVITLSALVA